MSYVSIKGKSESIFLAVHNLQSELSNQYAFPHQVYRRSSSHEVIMCFKYYSNISVWAEQ